MKWLWEMRWLFERERDAPKQTGGLDSSHLAREGRSCHLDRTRARSGLRRTLKMKREGMLDVMERGKLKKRTGEENGMVKIATTGK